MTQTGTQVGGPLLKVSCELVSIFIYCVRIFCIQLRMLMVRWWRSRFGTLTSRLVLRDRNRSVRAERGGLVRRASKPFRGNSSSA
jgi:hypothetical protein